MTENVLHQAVLKALPDPMFVLDADGRYLSVIGSSERSLYDSAAYLTGKRMHDVLCPEDADRFLAVIRSALVTGCLQVITYRLSSSDCRDSPKDGPEGEQWFEGRVYPLDRQRFSPPAVVWLCLNITERKRSEAAHARALAEIKTLQGIIPICSSCKKIRDDRGSWKQLEAYIQDHSEAKFSHGLCPDCLRRVYEEMERESPVKSLPRKQGAA